MLIPTKGRNSTSLPYAKLRSKFPEAQIAFVLRQAEKGTSVEEVCRKTGIGQATFYAWKKKYGGLLPSEITHRNDRNFTLATAHILHTRQSN